MGMVLTRLSFRKLRRSKGTYVGLYFLAIPFFAALYTFIIPQDFLHTNIKHEQGFRKDKHESLQAIQKGIESYLKGKPVDRYPEYAINSVSDVSYSDGGFTYTLELQKENEENVPYRKPNNCQRFLVQEEKETDSFKKQMLLHLYSQCLENATDRPSAILLDCRANSWSIEWDDEGGAVDVDKEDPQAIDRFLSETLSFVGSYLLTCSKSRTVTLSGTEFIHALDFRKEKGKQTSEQQIEDLMRNHEHLVNGRQLAATWALFWRMFYFSAVTITTLGYGDIVPISDHARMLVATESILGIILIGLFFNALTRQSET